MLLQMPLLTGAMHELNHLLILRFDRYDFDIAGANRFEHSRAIGGIGLIAAYVGANILRGKQADAMPQ